MTLSKDSMPYAEMAMGITRMIGTAHGISRHLAVMHQGQRDISVSTALYLSRFESAAA